jgi:hypothetical protein
MSTEGRDVSTMDWWISVMLIVEYNISLLICYHSNLHDLRGRVLKLSVVVQRELIQHRRKITGLSCCHQRWST